MSKCSEVYPMGVFNSETNEVEDISYPCELEGGHADEDIPHRFENNGKEYKWLDRAQTMRLMQK